MTADVPIRDAATVIVLRDDTVSPSVLMGQRGASAVFMPGKFVFPGGAVDDSDALVPISELSTLAKASLSEDSALTAETIAAAAIRELWEETGQIIGTPNLWETPPKDWESFAQTGHTPEANFEFFFRAVTPKGRPRRFDARFFVANASALQTDLDDFSKAEDELSHLQWIPIEETKNFDLPFITQIVLSELRGYISRGRTITSIPFFKNNDEAHTVARLGLDQD